ncbi:hypothetical protein BDV35DRAFT_56470 [Aspergillus flavus]|uniref:Uncharacterized protein n=1 Tax=Aspergillus flavus TaxID=5059 RepID=A0A5N6GHE9_ASPFL|nr:hypothetical protein BDV35DRAFT_56470 [Aspergillus flavus]
MNVALVPLLPPTIFLPFFFSLSVSSSTFSTPIVRICAVVYTYEVMCLFLGCIMGYRRLQYEFSVQMNC